MNDDDTQQDDNIGYEGLHQPANTKPVVAIVIREVLRVKGEVIPEWPFVKDDQVGDQCGFEDFVEVWD